MKGKFGPIALGFRSPPRPPISDEERAQILEMLESGAKSRAVAEKFGRAEVTVRGVARDAGLRLGPSRNVGPKPYRDVTMRLAEPVAKLLEAAAVRRGKSTPLLMSEIITGVVTRGSVDRLPDDIDHACELARSYEKREAVNVPSESLVEV